MKVKNFSYNGFSGRKLDGFATYTAEFKEWTDDPGVAKFTCSDGKERLIPTFAIEVEDRNFPPQPKTKTLFGQPSNS